MTIISKSPEFKLGILLLGLALTLGLTLAGEVPLISLAPQAPVNTGEASIEKAVKKAAQLNGAPSTPTIFNDVKRVAAPGNWAFGIVSIPGSSKEDELWTRLWLAQKTKNGWVAVTDFTPTFVSWVKQAPKDIVSEQERKILGGSSSQLGGIPLAFAGDASGNFSLPWKPGDSWNLNAGPHGQGNGYTKPWNSVDLAGGDQKVLAATGGLLYKTCWNGKTYSKVEIRQSDKWTTSYYHLNNTTNIKDGTYVYRGTYLADTGTTTGCGGSATGRHVHFSISYDGKQQAWNGREVSGWTIYEGAQAYDGYAEKNGKKVYASAGNGKALLYNPKYAIVTNASNRCLDASGVKVNDNGTPITLWDCHHGVNQQWKFVGSQIRNIEGKCLDAVNDGKGYPNGTKIVLWNCHGGDNQKWSLYSDGTIRGIGGKCLDAKNVENKFGNGTEIILWGCHGGVNQKWRKVD